MPIDKEKIFWISFDLGLKGDYNGLYKWLDNQNAKECGDSVAAFKRHVTSFNFVDIIRKELQEQVKFNSSDRVYLIWLEEETTTKAKGKFIIGKRKPAPWEGYGDVFEDQDEEF